MTIKTTPQKAKVYAVFDNPPTVFACMVNQTFTTHDKVYEFAFDGVTTGVETAVTPGMTVLIGSTLGGYDKGITYARAAFTSSMGYCGETSEVAWADNLFVTVLQDFGIWPEYPTVASDGTAWMHHNMAYTDQHSKMKPVPILGPDRVVMFAGSPVTVSFDGSASNVPGSTIASHSFTCSGGTVTGGSTATPSIVFTVAGRYLLTYTVTSALGASSRTYRTIHVADSSLLTEVIAGSIQGSWETGGYRFGMNSLNSNITVRERTKVILVSEEWYGDVLVSYGPIAGAENIVTFGWLDNEVITVGEEKGVIEFTAQGPHYWFQKMHNFVPFGMRSVAGTPASWLEMQNLTIDKMLWNFLMWRSTASNCIDIYLTGDTRQATELSAPGGNLWEQIKTISYQGIVAMPCCDRYGRLVIEVETVLLPVADRGPIPTSAMLSHDDWESISIERKTVNENAQVLLSGVAVSGTTGTSFFSLAPGHIPEHYGNPVSMERLLLSTQAQANELAGSLLEKDNGAYKFTVNNLLYNNRLVDICPRQYVNLTVSADDNLRGISYAGNVIVKTVELNLNDGAWDIRWIAEEETQANLSMSGTIPIVLPPDDPGNPGNPTDFPWPPVSPWYSPPTTPPDPPAVPPVASDCIDSSPANGAFYLAWDKPMLDGSDVTKLSTKSYQLCTIRSSGAANRTIIRFEMTIKGLPYTHLHCYGIDATGARIVTGTVSVVNSTVNYYYMQVAFSAVSPITVHGFELVLDAGRDLIGGGMALTSVKDWVTTTPITDPTFVNFVPKLYPGVNASGSFTTTLPGYDLAGGWFDILTTGTLITTNYLYGLGSNLSTKLAYAAPDPMGELWCYMSFQIVSLVGNGGIEFVYQDAVLGDVTVANASVSKLVKVSNTLPGILWRPEIHIGTGNGTTLQFVLRQQWSYGGATTARTAALTMGLLYNVCPAVSA